MRRRNWLRRLVNKVRGRGSQNAAPVPRSSGHSTGTRTEQFHCHSELEAVSEVLEWLEALQLDLTAGAMWECRVILVEAFTNVVRHAHRDRPESTPIQFTLEIWTDGMEIQVWDHGAFFDLSAMLETMRQQNEAEPLRYGSGRGLLLMDKVSDRLVYERRGDRNCLIAQKKLPRR